MHTGLILTVLTVHFVADFVLQSHWMASNKSKCATALISHTALYSVCWFCLWPVLGPLTVTFVVVTFLAHTVTDALTSQVTSALWAREQWHNFFVVVGLDQLLHYGQLFATLAVLLHG